MGGATADVYGDQTGSTITLNSAVLTNGLTSWAGTFNWEPENKIIKNLLYHSMHFSDWQEGTTFNDIGDATTYVGNVWLALQNGQTPDITVTAGGATDSFEQALTCTFDSAASQAGFVQFLNSKDTIGLRGKTVSVSCKALGTNVANLALNVIIWTGTADSPTKDVVGTWNNGSAHTLAASWAFGVTSVAKPITSTAAIITTNNIPIPTNANNIAIFISTWDNEASTDLFTFYDVQLECGPVVTAFTPRDFGDEVKAVQVWLSKSYSLAIAPGTVNGLGAPNYNTRVAIAATTAGTLRPGPITLPTPMWKIPAVTIYSSGTGTAGAVRNATAGNDRTGATAANVGTGALSVISISNASANAIALDDIIVYHYVADARF